MLRLLLLVALVGSALPARAQITVTQADYEAVLEVGGANALYNTESSAALEALANQTGANQTWDFTGLAYDPVYETVVTRVEPPVPGSDDAHLAQATHIFRIDSPDSTAYTFQVLRAGAATFLGLTGPNVLVRYLPEQLSAVLPFTFGTTWTSSYEVQFEPGFPPGVTLTTDEATSVVGWGTLVTPAGSTEALMIRTEVTNTLVFPGLPPIVNTSSQVLFTRYGLLNANIFLTPGSPTNGNYNVYDTDTAAEPPAGAGEALRFDPIASNPLQVGASLPLAFTLPTASTASLDVFDALGRRVARILDGQARPAGAQRVVWAMPVLPSGVYLVRLTAGGQQATRAFTVAR